MLAMLMIAGLLATGCQEKNGEPEHSHEEGHSHSHSDSGHSHDHDHDHGDGDHQPTGTPGPDGGRLIELNGRKAEFLFLEDRRIRITFLDESLNPVAGPEEASISIVGGDRLAPFELEFSAEGNAFVSTTAVPEGRNHPVVIQFGGDGLNESVIRKFNLNLSQCPDCDYLEYACICGHEDGAHNSGE
jgi:hypothetical protein